ncbi:MAG: 4Fe-4S dicluster domain-containing protein [Thermoplasmata archaeon]
MTEQEALADPKLARHRSRQTAKKSFTEMRRNFVIKFPRGKGVIAYVYEDICMGCIHCADNCPENVRPDLEDAIVFTDRTSYLPDLTFETRNAFIVDENCIGCAKCAVICPVEAIVMIPRPGWEVLDDKPVTVEESQGA